MYVTFQNLIAKNSQLSFRLMFHYVVSASSNVVNFNKIECAFLAIWWWIHENFEAFWICTKFDVSILIFNALHVQGSLQPCVFKR